MSGWNGAEFGKHIVDAVNASIDRQIAPLLKRIEMLENALADTDNGMIKSVEIQVGNAWSKFFGTEVQDTLSVMVSKAVAELPPAKDGASVTVDDVRPLIDEAVAKFNEWGEELIMAAVGKAVAELPPAKDGVDGRSVNIDDVRPLIVETVGKAVAELPPAKDGVDGRSVNIDDVRPLIVETVGKAVAELPPAKDGVDGRSVNIDDVRPLIVETVGKAVAELPPAKDGVDGRSVNIDDVRPLIVETVGKAVAELPPAKDGVDGRSVNIDDVRPLIVETVGKAVAETTSKTFDEYRKAVAAIPVPKDGVSVTIDDVRPVIDEAVSKAVAAIPVPKDGRDGADVMDALIAKDDHLHLTFSNGRTKDVGRVVGWDGVDVDFEKVNERISNDIKTLFDAVPKPQDGLGFDDLSIEYDGERVFKFVLSRGQERKEFAFEVPVMIYRDLYTEGKTYAKGDSVTWGGSVWVAQTPDATEKPGTGKQWRLAVKQGKPGRDGGSSTPRENKPVMLGG